MSQFLSKSAKRHALKYGLPFMLMVVGASFGVREYQKIRFDFSNKKSLSREEFEEEFGKKMKPAEEVTMDKVYDQVKTLDIDNWEPIRLPRPWEETGTPQN